MLRFQFLISVGFAMTRLAPFRAGMDTLRV